MKDKKSFKKLAAILVLAICILVMITIYAYLVLLPQLIKSNFLMKTLNKITYDFTKLELIYDSAQLKTYFSPKMDFEIKSLYLKKENNILLELKDFKTSISFNQIFSKKIKLNKLLATTLIIKADKLIESIEIKETQTEKQKK